MDSKENSRRRHNRHHHRKSRHQRKKQKMLILGLAAAVIFVGLAATVVVNKLKEQKNYHVTGANSVDVGAGYRYTEYNGKKYQYNNRVTTLLYAGLDSFDELKQTATYGDKARADSIMLIVLDEVSKKMSVVAINRDTMTEVHRFSRKGDDLGVYVTHLGYAYTNGDGGEASCENLKTAVSTLFNNLPIDGYMVSNQTSIVMINDLVGGVTVTVPNDDLAAKYPELTTGNVVTLDESNVRAYVQQRDTAVDFSNEGRIERQKSFVLSFMDEFGTMVKEDASSVWDSLEACSDWMQTDITKNKYLSLADAFSNTNLTPDSYYILEGEDQLGELHDEFYYDEDALQELIIKLFYREI
jgi:LCP family protein required for cell wall assembly